MKLSVAIVVGMNMLAATGAAAHAGESINDTSDWIQDSLTSLKAAPAKSMSASPLKVSNQSRSSLKKASSLPTTQIGSKTVRLRAFKPGRYLPSESELAMAASQPRYDYSLERTNPYESGIPLSGKISAYDQGKISAYDQVKPSANESKEANYAEKLARAASTVKQMAKSFKGQSAIARSIPGLNSLMPGQYAPVPEPPATKPVRVMEPPPSDSQYNYSMQQVPLVPQPPTRQLPIQQGPLVQAPTFSPEEEAEFAQLVRQSLPPGSIGLNGDMNSSAYGNPSYGAGQATFPLNNSQAQAMRRGRSGHSPLGVQARFGSWHGNQANQGMGASANGAGAQGLPRAAFHSYLPSRLAGPIYISHAKAQSKVQGQRHRSRKASGSVTVQGLRRQQATSRQYIAYKPDVKSAPVVATYAVSYNQREAF